MFGRVLAEYLSKYKIIDTFLLCLTKFLVLSTYMVFTSNLSFFIFSCPKCQPECGYYGNPIWTRNRI